MKLDTRNIKDLKSNPHQTRISNIENIDTVELGQSIRDLNLKGPGYSEHQELKELGESILENGLLQPIVIDTENTVIAGHRRVAACKMMNIEKIKCLVLEIQNDDERLVYNILENIQRVDLTVIEYALALKQLQVKMKIPQSEISFIIKKSAASVSKYLNLLTLHDDIQNDIIDNKRVVNRLVLDRLATMPKSLYKSQKEIYFKFINDEINNHEAIFLINEKLNEYYQDDTLFNLDPVVSFSKTGLNIKNIVVPKEKRELIQKEILNILNQNLSKD